jgi:hypothetical protein
MTVCDAFSFQAAEPCGSQLSRDAALSGKA